MPFQVTSTEKKCATCAYWSGSRQKAQGGLAASVESPSARGTCEERTRGGVAVSANQACSKYQRWTELRG